MDGTTVQKGGLNEYADAMAQPLHDHPDLTAAEFEIAARTGVYGSARLELRDGEIVEVSPQHFRHGWTKTVLAEALRAAAEERPTGLMVMQEVSLGLGEYFQPLPDIVLWDPTALSDQPIGPLPGHAVRLVIEVSDSTLADDLGAKLKSYAAAGVTEYWVADMTGRWLLLHSDPTQEGYTNRVPVAFGNPAVALTLPLTLDTSRLKQA